MAALLCGQVTAQTTSRTLSGVVITEKNETVADATLIVRTAAGEQKTVTDTFGNFSVIVPVGALDVRIEGKNLELVERSLAAGETTENLTIRIKYIIPPVHESVVIQAGALDPTIDQR